MTYDTFHRIIKQSLTFIFSWIEKINIEKKKHVKEKPCFPLSCNSCLQPALAVRLQYITTLSAIKRGKNEAGKLK